MSRRVEIEWDHAGFDAILKSSEVAGAVRARADAAAGYVRSVVEAEDGVVVDDYTTDRAASSVTIRDIRGKLWQVRDGVLSRAAVAAGLEFRSRA